MTEKMRYIITLVQVLKEYCNHFMYLSRKYYCQEEI